MGFGEKATKEEEETGHKEAIQKFTKTFNMNSESLQKMTKNKQGLTNLGK